MAFRPCHDYHKFAEQIQPDYALVRPTGPGQGGMRYVRTGLGGMRVPRKHQALALSSNPLLSASPRHNVTSKTSISDDDELETGEDTAIAATRIARDSNPSAVRPSGANRSRSGGMLERSLYDSIRTDLLDANPQSKIFRKVENLASLHDASHQLERDSTLLERNPSSNLDFPLNYKHETKEKKKGKSSRVSPKFLNDSYSSDWSDDLSFHPKGKSLQREKDYVTVSQHSFYDSPSGFSTTARSKRLNDKLSNYSCSDSDSLYWSSDSAELNLKPAYTKVQSKQSSAFSAPRSRYERELPDESYSSGYLSTSESTSIKSAETLSINHQGSTEARFDGKLNRKVLTAEGANHRFANPTYRHHHSLVKSVTEQATGYLKPFKESSSKVLPTEFQPFFTSLFDPYESTSLDDIKSLIKSFNTKQDLASTRMSSSRQNYSHTRKSLSSDYRSSSHNSSFKSEAANLLLKVAKAAEVDSFSPKKDKIIRKEKKVSEFPDCSDFNYKSVARQIVGLCKSKSRGRREQLCRS